MNDRRGSSKKKKKKKRNDFNYPKNCRDTCDDFSPRVTRASHFLKIIINLLILLTLYVLKPVL